VIRPLFEGPNPRMIVPMDARCARNLKPAEMAALVKSKGRAAFADAIDTALLLVRLDDARGDLALALEAALEEGSATAGWRPEPSLGYDTVVGSAADLRGVGLFAGRTSFDGADLAKRLLRAPHFAVTLHKRRGATNVFSERISVGRARTNDIVLRHHSVSKFHAWFERDENDRYYASDARSTNATHVNGVDIARSSPVGVEDGAEIRFGEVVTVFCAPEILWDALNVVAPPSGGSVRPPPGGSGRRGP
jgi:hypothetical protein